MLSQGVSVCLLLLVSYTLFAYQIQSLPPCGSPLMQLREHILIEEGTMAKTENPTQKEETI